ncbi:unnamed protein product [Dovyalis caffra]|uniref:Uncharacterized protein n=1 Tax=Dovyalis caffra TaxID=77055 RepID=A0AAV1QQ82_9ROSI|nr:unnamed protein product [Dovyalis caffra]
MESKLKLNIRLRVSSIRKQMEELMRNSQAWKPYNAPHMSLNRSVLFVQEKLRDSMRNLLKIRCKKLGKATNVQNQR